MKNALLILDMQNYFFRSKEKKANYPELVSSINNLIEFFMNSDDTLICHVISVHKKDRSTWSNNMRKADTGCLLEGSEDILIVSELINARNQLVINKTRHSAFMRTELEKIFIEKGIIRIFLCGVYTHGCIALTAIDGWSLDFEIVIASDCIFSHRPELSEFMEERLKNMFQIEFLSNKQIIERLTI